MNKELAAKWVKALKSGKYKQTTVVLSSGLDLIGGKLVIHNKREGVQYCCLGVLCRVAEKMPEFKDYAETIREGVVDEANLNFTVRRPGKRGALFIRKIGMTDAQEEIFINMNDMAKSTFAEIAEKVRKIYKV
jgi:hypothetical protein